MLVPVRAIMLIVVLVSAWLVAKIGMLGLDKSEIESFTISRKGTQVVFEVLPSTIKRVYNIH